MSTEQWTRLSTDAFNVALFAYVAGILEYFTGRRDVAGEILRVTANE